MATLELQPADQKKTRRKLHASPRIDMTPMVDLGFLLITFFIFTTTLSEPRAAQLIVPADGEGTDVPESKALTLLLGPDNQVIAYEGRWEDAIRQQKLKKSNYHVYQGIGKLVREKQQQLQRSSSEGRDGLVLVIKPTSGSSYKNVIDALDETIINNVKKYAIVEPSADETSYVQKHG